MDMLLKQLLKPFINLGIFLVFWIIVAAILAIFVITFIPDYREQATTTPPIKIKTISTTELYNASLLRQSNSNYDCVWMTTPLTNSTYKMCVNTTGYMWAYNQSAGE